MSLWNGGHMQEALDALDAVGGDLSNGQARFMEALANIELASPLGTITLNENRQATGSVFVTEVVEGADGNLQSVFRARQDGVTQTLGMSIEAYRDIAGFDISQNPGVTATLYNVGNPEARARALKAENRRLAAGGKPPRLPQENYYGWFVNDRLDELKALF